MSTDLETRPAPGIVAVVERVVDLALGLYCLWMAAELLVPRPWTPRAWHYAARGLQRTALVVGTAGLQAEYRYRRAVDSATLTDH